MSRDNERDEGNTARWEQAIKSYKDRTEWSAVKAQGNPHLQHQGSAGQVPFHLHSSKLYMPAECWHLTEEIADLRAALKASRGYHDANIEDGDEDWAALVARIRQRCYEAIAKIDEVLK